MNPRSLSIVIPAYNESKRLQKTFTALLEFLKQPPFSSVEVIFVNDGSTDDTEMILEERCKRMKWRLISYGSNRGKGYAVREGFKAATGDYILLMDADMSTPLSEIEKFIPAMEAGSPVIIGTRKAVGAEVAVHQPLLRETMGKVFTMIAGVIMDLKVSDFTCGFKCFSRVAPRAIARAARIDRWSYDAEFLYLARKVFGFEIKEIPVLWYNDPRTSVRLFSATLSSLRDLFLIRWRWRRGGKLRRRYT